MEVAREYYNRGCTKFALSGKPNMVVNENKTLFKEELN
jgi:hypothetical protein